MSEWRLRTASVFGVVLCGVGLACDMSQVPISNAPQSRFYTQQQSGVLVPIGEQETSQKVMSSGSGQLFVQSSRELDDRSRFMSQKPIPPMASSAQAIESERERQVHRDAVGPLGRLMGRSKSVSGGQPILGTPELLFMAAEGGYGPKLVEGATSVTGPFARMGDADDAYRLTYSDRNLGTVPLVAGGSAATALVAERALQGRQSPLPTKAAMAESSLPSARSDDQTYRYRPRDDYGDARDPRSHAYDPRYDESARSRPTDRREGDYGYPRDVRDTRDYRDSRDYQEYLEYRDYMDKKSRDYQDPRGYPESYGPRDQRGYGGRGYDPRNDPSYGRDETRRGFEPRYDDERAAYPGRGYREQPYDNEEYIKRTRDPVQRSHYTEAKDQDKLQSQRSTQSPTIDLDSGAYKTEQLSAIQTTQKPLGFRERAKQAI